MTLEEIRTILGWCTLINFALLLIWFFMIVGARNWTHRLHGKWFKLTPEKFDELHYKLMGQFKLMVFVFNMAPYLAMRIAL